MTIRLGKQFVRVGTISEHGEGSFGWSSVGDLATYEVYLDHYPHPDAFFTVKVLVKDPSGRQETIADHQMGGKEMRLLPAKLTEILQDLSSRGVPPEDVSELQGAFERSFEKALGAPVSLG